jgi:hypothetical protein
MSDLSPQAAVLTAVISSAPATPAPAAPTAPAIPPVPPGTPFVEPHSHNGLSPSQAAQMIDWTRQDIASGKLSSEQAEKIFDDLDVPVDQSVAPGETRSDDVQLLDHHFPAAKPEEYQIRYADPGQPVQMTKELQQFDTSARTWLSQAEFPRELGNSLIVNIEKVAQHTKAMTLDQLESYWMTEYEKLERANGDSLEEKLNAAGHMVVALDQKTPGLKNLLRSRGIGDSALIASMLIGQAERYWARRR